MLPTQAFFSILPFSDSAPDSVTCFRVETVVLLSSTTE